MTKLERHADGRIKLPPVDPRPPDVVLGEAIANAYADADTVEIDIGDGDSFAWLMADVFRYAARQLRQRGHDVGVYALWRLTGKRNPAKAGAGKLGGLAAGRSMTQEQRRERARKGGNVVFYGDADGADLGAAVSYGKLLRHRRTLKGEAFRAERRAKHRRPSNVVNLPRHR